MQLRLRRCCETAAAHFSALSGYSMQRLRSCLRQVQLLSQLTCNPLLLLLLLPLITIAAAVTQQHVRKLKSMFDSIDLGGSGSIDCQEFLDHIDVPRSPFTDVVFKMVGLDPKGSVSFSSLLCMVAEYCMFTRDEILRCEFLILLAVQLLLLLLLLLLLTI
jgi:hypothetical protein